MSDHEQYPAGLDGYDDAGYDQTDSGGYDDQGYEGEDVGFDVEEYVDQAAQQAVAQHMRPSPHDQAREMHDQEVMRREAQAMRDQDFEQLQAVHPELRDDRVLLPVVETAARIAQTLAPGMVDSPAFVGLIQAVYESRHPHEEQDLGPNGLENRLIAGLKRTEW